MRKILTIATALVMMVAFVATAGINDRFSPIELTDIQGATKGQDIVTKTYTQTLTNKTLTSPTINGGSINTATISGATGSGGTYTNITLSGAIPGSTATITGPTLSGGTFTGSFTTTGGTFTGGTFSGATHSGGTLSGAITSSAATLAGGTFTSPTINTPTIASPTVNSGDFNQPNILGAVISHNIITVEQWDLSASEEKARFLVLASGSAGVTVGIYGSAPNGALKVIRNASNNTVTIKKSGATGVSIASGKTAVVFSNGTDYYRVSADATH